MIKQYINKELREAIIIFLIVFIGYGYFSFGFDWNINSRLALVKAFVDEGRFEIDSYHEAELETGDKAYFNDHYYSDKAIGSSLLGVIVYYPIHWWNMLRDVVMTTQAFRQWVTIFSVSLPATLIAPLLFFLIKYLTNDTLYAFVITIGICLGTPLFKYSTAFYGHSLAAVSYFSAWNIWFYARRNKFISLRRAFSSTLLLGFMIITEYPTFVLFGIILLYIIYILYESNQLFDWKIYGVMLIGFMIPVCMLFCYNYSVFGSILATGYSFENQQEFQLAHAQNFLGIGLPNPYNFWYQTFHPAIGIFWQSPILLLSLLGWIYMFRSKEYRIEAIFSFIAIISYILLFSGYYLWWGGISFSPRHLIPIFPLFAFPLAFLPKKFILPLILFTFVSVFQNLILAACSLDGLKRYVEYYLEPHWIKYGVIEPKTILIYDFCLPDVVNGNLANNRGMSLGLKGVFSLLPLLLAELVMSWMLFRQKKVEL